MKYANIEGRILKLSNPDKILYPATGFTKGDVLRYYRKIASTLLPHLRGRPLTLKRYPNGVLDEYFFQKTCPADRPSWMRTLQHGSVRYCTLTDAASLIWVANLASIELHVTLSKADLPDTPSILVFDLDPGAPAGIPECAKVGLLVRKKLEDLGLESWIKTSGMKGLQIYVPLNTPTTYEKTKSFARTLAEILERENPSLITSKMAKKLRPGKVFIDWSQNDPNKTTVCVYSLRAAETPSVSTPLLWKEVEKLKRSDFSPEQVIRRVEKHGDLFAPLLTLRQKLPSRMPGSRRLLRYGT